MTSKPSETMVSRLLPATPPGGTALPATPPSGGLGFLIEIPAADGTMLLRLFERDGRLVAEGDESRWDEGAKRFVYAMMQWSGLAGIRWKNEAREAEEE